MAWKPAISRMPGSAGDATRVSGREKSEVMGDRRRPGVEVAGRRWRERGAWPMLYAGRNPVADAPTMNARLIRRYILRETLGIVGMGVVLLWPAGRLNWWQAWAALAVSLGWLVGIGIVVIGRHPGLLAERLGPRRGANRWDTLIVSLMGLVTMIRYMVAGFDQRYAWSGGFSSAAQIIALVMGGLGYALFVWAMTANAFFSQIVRIQTERSHIVATGGPYRFVRHPAYLGVILYEATISVLLGSWVALAVSAMSVALLIARTALEDRVLRVELSGYADYAGRVRYRLLPGVW